MVILILFDSICEITGNALDRLVSFCYQWFVSLCQRVQRPREMFSGVRQVTVLGDTMVQSASETCNGGSVVIHHQCGNLGILSLYLLND